MGKEPFDPPRSLRAKFPRRKFWCGRRDEFIPSLAEGNPHLLCVWAKIDGAICQAALLNVTPTFDLYFANSGGMATGMGFKPNQSLWTHTLCIG